MCWKDQNNLFSSFFLQKMAAKERRLDGIQFTPLSEELLDSW
jgi:hypothetical protein